MTKKMLVNALIAASCALAFGTTSGFGAPDEKSPASCLNLVLRLWDDGRVEVVRATELPGNAVFSDVLTGPYVYEVTKGGKTIAVETFGDPFEVRSFGGPGDETHGHHFERSRTALVVVKVPKTRLSDTDLDQLAIRLNRIDRDLGLDTVNESALLKLRQHGALRPLWEMRNGTLAGELRRKGRTVR
jgi:hypothetical protein